jgi:hypothetical protein
LPSRSPPDATLASGGDEMLDQIVKRAVERIRKPCNDPLSGSLMDTVISRS